MFKKILVPIDVDYPRTAAAVYQKAAAIAGLSNAEIRLVSVMPGFGMPIVASYISDEMREKSKNRFKESLEKFIEENCDKTVTYRLRIGKKLGRDHQSRGQMGGRPDYRLPQSPS